MKHVKPIVRTRPVFAQFESVLQLMSVFQVALALLQQTSAIFGFNIPQKSVDEAS